MAVAFLNSNTGVVQAGTSFSTSLSVTNSGANRVAFAVVVWDSSGLTDTITAITYGGTAMTSCGVRSTNHVATFQNAQIFYLINPPTGPNTLAITGGANVNEIYANIVAFTGVDQTTPVRPGTYQGPTNPQTSGGTPNTKSLTITSNANDLTITTIIDGVGMSGGGTNQTGDTADIGGNQEQYSDHASTAAVSVTHTWTLVGTTVENVALCGFSIQTVSAAAASHSTRMLCGMGT